ncbi:hypothetical protein FOZ60_016507 [Perkinsus olseni]|uniref:Uncharacterized protein n=1 Tax=Perkinsus olseni TaxID=32597 RepID=A0A7J6N3P0_PEROL|nr:hypothetical protein FOZ60_016507 [Perkinsus olseni]
MSTTSALPSQTVDDEQLLRLAERIAALRLSTDSRSSLRDSTTHSKTLSCFSFLRGIFSNRTHAATTPFRPIVRPLGTTQSDPGVVERNMQPRGPLQDLPNDDTSSSMGPSQLGSVARSGLSAVDLERVHDSSFKRAKDTQLPAGGAFMGHADSRSVDMFLQEVTRAPGWSVGVMPQLFQAYYLEFSLDVSVRGVITGIVDKDLKQRGLEGYDALVARAAAIESALRARLEPLYTLTAKSLELS